MKSKFSEEAVRMQDLSPVEQLNKLREQPALSIVNRKPTPFKAPLSYLKDSKVDEETVDRMLNQFMQSEDPLVEQYQEARHYEEYWTEFGEVVQLSPRALALLRPKILAQELKSAGSSSPAVPRRAKVEDEKQTDEKKLKFAPLTEQRQLEINKAAERLAAEKRQLQLQKKEETLNELRRQRLMVESGVLPKESYYNTPEVPLRHAEISKAKPTEHKPNSLRYAQYLEKKGKDASRRSKNAEPRTDDMHIKIERVGRQPESFASGQSKSVCHISFSPPEEVLNTVFQSVEASDKANTEYHAHNFVLSPQNLREESDYEPLGGEAWDALEFQ